MPVDRKNSLINCRNYPLLGGGSPHVTAERVLMRQAIKQEHKVMNEQANKMRLLADNIRNHYDNLATEDRALLVAALNAHAYDVERDEKREADQQHARDQARAQMSSIAEMVAALTCDYDRLEELRDELTEAHKGEGTESTFAQWIENQANSETGTFQEAAAEYLELTEAAGDCESEEDARERIQEDPLSVEVRSGWGSPGALEDIDLEEFTILLCTGGPAVRIMGELDRGEPSRAWLEYQDWGTPWIEYLGDNFSMDTLLSYCRTFYFGE